MTLDAAAGRSLVQQLQLSGLDANLLRRMTQGPDNLRTPLKPTRETALRDDPLAVAVRLFFCGSTVDASQGSVWPLPEGIVVSIGQGQVEAPFHLRIVRGLFLFSDYLNGPPDAVMGAGQTTAILYQAAKPSRPAAHSIDRVLDLGCGAGTLALLLARDADHAVGVDISERAVTLARFNAAVNDVQNVEFRQGDLFAPVAGETFDLIVSQPPYYPVGVGFGEGESHGYLHGGPRGDEIAQQILDQLPAHLAPGGRGIIFTSWPDDRAAPSSKPFRILELHADRREVYGARQSLTVIEHAVGKGWKATREVPGDCWGDVHAWRIDQILAAEELLSGPDTELLRFHFAMPQGAQWLEEAGVRFLRCPPEALVALTPVDARLAEVIHAVQHEGYLEPTALRTCLERGLLVV